MDSYHYNELVQRFEQMIESGDMYYFDSEQFIEIIEYYLDFSDVEYAFKALSLASEQYPENISLKIKWLEYFVQTKNLKKAQTLIEGLVELEPNDTDLLIAIAQYWSARKRHYFAIRYYKKALKNEEEEDFILSAIGNEYLELNEVSKALENFLKSLRINPLDEYAFYSIIHCYEALDHNQACISFLEKYIDEHPYSENAWFQLGMKQAKVEEYANAYQSFDFAVVINPDSVINHTQKAICLECLGYWEEAIKVYQEALEYEEIKAQLMLSIANCFIQLKEPKHALGILKQALKEDPNFDALYFEISKIYEHLGNLQESLYYTKKAVELDIKNLDFLRKQTYLHIKLQHFEEAIIDFKNLLKLEPHRFTSHYAFSELLLSIGEFEEAVAFLNQNKLRFGRAEFYYQLSSCYLYLHKTEKAEDALGKAMEINPKILKKTVDKYPILKDIAKDYIKK